MKHRVLVLGAAGRMGQAVVEAVTEADDMEFVGGVGRGDDLQAVIRATNPTVLVDFTVPESVLQNIHIGLQAGLPLVVGTTGLSAEQLQSVDDEARRRGLGVVFAPNFALGAIFMMKFAAEAARYFSNVEIIELHHEKKHEAPSGTAMQTAALIGGARDAAPSDDDGKLELVDGARGGVHSGVRIHSVRLPGFVAHQEVIFGSPGETLRIRHDLVDRRSFMPGVLLAIRRVADLRGLHGLEELLFADH